MKKAALLPRMFGRDQIVDDADDSGIRMIDIGRAVMVWAFMNAPRPATVQEAARTFNTTADIIREAVNLCPWTFLSVDFIEIDGE